MQRIAVVCALALCLAGCQTKAPQKEETGYQLKGTVIASNAEKGEVSVDSQAIPGYMGPMTMAYKLAQSGIASELHPGDRLTARLRVSGSSATLDQIVVVEQAKPDYRPVRLYNIPQTNQVVPDFKLVNQNGETISFKQFQGKVLVVTFIYTRCPLPDYCIRMSRNLAEVQKQLATDPQLYAQTHLLSISFDPAYDTPRVLRTYGMTYTGEGGSQAFAHWDFAVPPARELDAVDEFFDVGVSTGSNQTLTHSLSTAVITPDGKIFRWYPTNEWSPAAVVGDIKQALASASRSQTASPQSKPAIALGSRRY